MECEFFGSFRHFESEIHSGTVTRGESPDFRVDLGDRVVGVEVTQLFSADGGQDIESTQERILETVRRKAQEQNLPPAHVSLFFNLYKPLGSAARSRVADTVVDLVAARMPPEGESVALDGVAGQPHEVDLITINRVHCGARGRWIFGPKLCTISGDVVGLVQHAISRKADKLLIYRECCDECWLLLVANSFRTPGRLAFDRGCQSHVFRSPFARTYVLDFGIGRLHRLLTSLTNQ